MATASSVGKSQFTMPSDREFVTTRIFDAPRPLVWEAWTNPKHLSTWLLGPDGWTMPVCEMDLRPGGAWRYVWRRQDGTEMEMTGTYREVKPPEKLVQTERWGPDWPETINSLVFAEDGEQTVMTMTILYPSKEARDAATATGMTSGMDRSFERLDEYLRSAA
jgi:uncharacterized protein YndB with AHSA1/START domain